MTRTEWTCRIESGKLFVKYRKDFDAFIENLPDGEYVLVGPYSDADDLHDPKYRKAYFARNRWLARQMIETGNTESDLDDYAMAKMGFFETVTRLGITKAKYMSHTKLTNEQWMALINVQEQLSIEQGFGPIPGREENFGDNQIKMFD